MDGSQDYEIGRICQHNTHLIFPFSGKARTVVVGKRNHSHAQAHSIFVSWYQAQSVTHKFDQYCGLRGEGGKTVRRKIDLDARARMCIAAAVSQHMATRVVRRVAPFTGAGRQVSSRLGDRLFTVAGYYLKHRWGRCCLSKNGSLSNARWGESHDQCTDVNPSLRCFQSSSHPATYTMVRRAFARSGCSSQQQG